MPDFALLHCALLCPACGAAVPLPDGVLRFQWGRLPARYEAAPVPLAWLRSDRDELWPPYALPEDEGDPWNAGAPEPGTVCAFDDDPRLRELCCRSCGQAFERIAAKIVGDVLQGAMAFRPGELALKASAVEPSSYCALVSRQDGSWEPRPDWEAQEAGVTVLEDL